VEEISRMESSRRYRPRPRLRHPDRAHAISRKRNAKVQATVLIQFVPTTLRITDSSSPFARSLSGRGSPA